MLWLSIGLRELKVPLRGHYPPRGSRPPPALTVDFVVVTAEELRQRVTRDLSPFCRVIECLIETTHGLRRAPVCVPRERNPRKAGVGPDSLFLASLAVKGLFRKSSLDVQFLQYRLQEGRALL